MTPRLWVRARVVGTRYLLRLHGVLDGSTACQVLDAVAAAPGPVREVVVDLEGLAAAEPFGLEVLVRGLPVSARSRTVRIHGTPAPRGLLAE
jgi:anti-anti-sigma regulatory factor